MVDCFKRYLQLRAENFCAADGFVETVDVAAGDLPVCTGHNDNFVLPCFVKENTCTAGRRCLIEVDKVRVDAEVGIHLLLRAAVRIVTQPLQQEHVTAELLRNNGLSRALAADDDVIIVADQRLTAAAAPAR